MWVRINGVEDQGRRERGAGGDASPTPATISWNEIFFPTLKHKIFVKFLHVNKIRDFCLFIEQDISDKK